MNNQVVSGFKYETNNAGTAVTIINTVTGERQVAPITMVWEETNFKTGKTKIIKEGSPEFKKLEQNLKKAKNNN